VPVLNYCTTYVDLPWSVAVLGRSNPFLLPAKGSSISVSSWLFASQLSCLLVVSGLSSYVLIRTQAAGLLPALHAGKMFEIKA